MASSLLVALSATLFGSVAAIAQQALNVHAYTVDCNTASSDVRGRLKHKESGLIVLRPSSPNATFENVRLDSIRAFNTTQWSGIFLAGGSREHPLRLATVSNSVVHDVQGEGIVLFNAEEALADPNYRAGSPLTPIPASTPRI